MTNTIAAVSVDDLAARWLPMLLDATIKGTAILVLAGVALLAMRRASAAARQLRGSTSPSSTWSALG